MTGPGEAGPGVMSDAELAEAMALLMREYARRSEEGAEALARAAGWAERLTATQTAVVAVDLLRAAEITSFELAAMFNV